MTIICRDCQDKGYILNFWTFCHCAYGRTLRAEAEQIERAQEPVPEGQMTLGLQIAKEDCHQ